MNVGIGLLVVFCLGAYSFRCIASAVCAFWLYRAFYNRVFPADSATPFFLRHGLSLLCLLLSFVVFSECFFNLFPRLWALIVATDFGFSCCSEFLKALDKKVGLAGRTIVRCFLLLRVGKFCASALAEKLVLFLRFEIVRVVLRTRCYFGKTEPYPHMPRLLLLLFLLPCA
jgi:hypothetical protein